jgi:hypothetical protein
LAAGVERRHRCPQPCERHAHTMHTGCTPDVHRMYRLNTNSIKPVHPVYIRCASGVHPVCMARGHGGQLSASRLLPTLNPTPPWRLESRQNRRTGKSALRQAQGCGWRSFPPCTRRRSLLQVVPGAARNATPGDLFLLSPACPGSNQSRNRHRIGSSFGQAVKSTGRGAYDGTPNIHGQFAVRLSRHVMNYLLRSFLRENPVAQRINQNNTSKNRRCSATRV